MRCLHGARFDPRSSDQERYPDVELEREALSFDQTKLSQMVTMVGRVDDVCVVQLPQVFQFLVNLLTSGRTKINERSGETSGSPDATVARASINTCLQKRF